MFTNKTDVIHGKDEHGNDVKVTKRELDKQFNDMAHKLMAIGSNMWSQLKRIIKENPKFIEWPDKKKLELFRNKLKFDKFMSEYPVMTRYLVCMGQYSTHAFKRFLVKVRNSPHPTKCDKGYKEDQWIRRQADYVQYLWEVYQPGHYNSATRKMVWQDAYKNLKGEFDDFRDKYKAIEESVKQEKVQLKASNARDLIKRLSEGVQTIPDDEMRQLISKLTNKKYKHNYNIVMGDIVRRESIRPVCTGLGTGEKYDANKPRILMREHVPDTST